MTWHLITDRSVIFKVELPTLKPDVVMPVIEIILMD